MPVTAPSLEEGTSYILPFGLLYPFVNGLQDLTQNFPPDFRWLDKSCCMFALPSSRSITARKVSRFTREVLDIPVPHVLTWSDAERDSVNRVGADYIIMEEVAGICLGLRWKKSKHSDEINNQSSLVYWMWKPSSSVSASPTLTASILKKTITRNFNRYLFSENKLEDAHIAQFSERYRAGIIIDCQWWRMFGS